jgi:hypothetical protein
MQKLPKKRRRKRRRSKSPNTPQPEGTPFYGSEWGKSKDGKNDKTLVRYKKASPERRNQQSDYQRNNSRTEMPKYNNDRRHDSRRRYGSRRRKDSRNRHGQRLLRSRTPSRRRNDSRSKERKEYWQSWDDWARYGRDAWSVTGDYNRDWRESRSNGKDQATNSSSGATSSKYHSADNPAGYRPVGIKVNPKAHEAYVRQSRCAKSDQARPAEGEETTEAPLLVQNVVHFECVRDAVNTMVDSK